MDNYYLLLGMKVLITLKHLTGKKLCYGLKKLSSFKANDLLPSIIRQI